MKIFRPVSGWLMMITLPFLLFMTAVRLLITPVFADIEYRMPGFPDDSYGFTIAERLQWSKVSIDYLLNDQGIKWLGNFQLSDGSSLYNERELSHMLDVKILVQTMIAAYSVVILFWILVGIWAWRSDWLMEWGQFIMKGGWFTIGLVGFILAGITVSFNALFTGFHQIFFQGDSWLFQYSDTLIRLFPMRFWQDAFIFMGIITLAGAMLCIFIGKKLSRNHPRP